MKKYLFALMFFIVGCSTLIVERNDPLFEPIYSVSNGTNLYISGYHQFDPSWKVTYRKYGFDTQISDLYATITTNKTVQFKLGGMNSNISTNFVIIHSSSVGVIPDVAGSIVDAIVRSDTNKVIQIMTDFSQKEN